MMNKIVHLAVSLSSDKGFVYQFKGCTNQQVVLDVTPLICMPPPDAQRTDGR